MKRPSGSGELGPVHKNRAGLPMIRSELVQKLCTDFPDLTQREVEGVVSAIFDSITEQLAHGGRVELRGFGAFSTRQRDARIGRNPRTGESVSVNAKRVPYSSRARKCASGSTSRKPTPSYDCIAVLPCLSDRVRAAISSGRGGTGRRWRLKIFCP